MAYGFPYIYEAMKDSILPIVHQGRENSYQIGTSFIIGHDLLITASHCIVGARSIAIRGIPGSTLRSSRIYVSKNDAIDLALIKFSEGVFQINNIIVHEHHSILQEVMAFGYPNIAGLIPTLAAEKAVISARYIATRGIVASTPFDIFAKQALLLITARVRGGFSGGPIVDQRGRFVGMISRNPLSQSEANDSTAQKYDDLGYGIAIPSQSIVEFVENAVDGTDGGAIEFDARQIEMYDFSDG